MEKDIIQPVNISILNDMLKEQEQKYEKRIAELENKIYTLQGAFDYQVRSNGKINEFRMKYLKKLNKIKIYCETKLEPCKTCVDLDCENKNCGDYRKACEQILEIIEE